MAINPDTTSEDIYFSGLDAFSLGWCIESGNYAQKLWKALYGLFKGYKVTSVEVDSLIQQHQGARFALSYHRAKTVRLISPQRETLSGAAELRALSGAISARFAVPLGQPSSRANYDGAKAQQHYLFSYEFSNSGMPIHKQHPLDYKRTIAMLENAPLNKTPPASNAHKVAVLVGDSCLLASLPELAKHSHLVLMVDYDPLLLNLQLKRLELLRRCNTVMDEGKFIAELRNYVDQYAPNYPFEEQYQVYRTNCGEYYPFSSQARLDAVQESLRHLQFVPAYCNLFDAQDMNNLRELLQQHNAQIEFMNLSNAMEFVWGFHGKNPFSFHGGKPAPYKHLRHLPFSDSGCCAFATRQTTVNQTRFEDFNTCWSTFDEQGRLLAMERAKVEGEDAPAWLAALSSTAKFTKHEGFDIRLKTLLACAKPEDLAALKANGQPLRATLTGQGRKDLCEIIDLTLQQ